MIQLLPALFINKVLDDRRKVLNWDGCFRGITESTPDPERRIDIL